ncbi:MAG: translation elongation factor Ts [Deltaproteobacteria bacterium RIFCSPHIGHO2_12_FULL_43_9]|nr:MAG: translation elongation factor Ts [Deltaproteobacteria bacterium RIFCSPHIGHO2_12_FULL_43_9]
MNISADKVRDLREKTGAGILDCKKALQESGGNMDKAIEFLRKAGLAAAKKKTGRIASEGVVSSYIHANGKIGVLVEINCETDFVARTDDFQRFVKDVGMQIAASNPFYVSEENIPPEVLEKEREINREKAQKSGKPATVLDKIVEGQLKKYYEEVCLLDQPFVKDPNKKIRDLTHELISKLGENISIRRFARYQLGEGLEKRSQNFAQEVAAITKS